MNENPHEYELREALLDVRAPAALKSRIMDRLRIESGVAESDDSSSNRPTVETLQEVALRGPAAELAASKSPAASKAMSRRGWMAAAASTAAGIGGLYYFMQPAPLHPGDIARGAVDLAVALDDGLVQDWSSESDSPPFLQNQLDFARLQIGNIASASLADDFFHGGRKRLDVWRMIARSQNAGFHDFYLARTDCPPLVNPLPRNFKPLPSSGVWSVAALEAGSDLYVLMTTRRVEELLRHQQLA